MVVFIILVFLLTDSWAITCETIKQSFKEDGCCSNLQKEFDTDTICKTKDSKVFIRGNVPSEVRICSGDTIESIDAGIEIPVGQTSWNYLQYDLLRKGYIDITVHDRNYPVLGYKLKDTFVTEEYIERFGPVLPIDDSYSLWENNLPFGMTGDDFALFLHAGGGYEKVIEDTVAKYGSYPLRINFGATQPSGWIGVKENDGSPINLEEVKQDMLAWVKGRFGRFGGLSGLVWEHLGLTLTSISLFEVGSAFESGAIQFGEMVGPSVDSNLGVVSQNRTLAWIPKAWGESSPGAWMEIRNEVWESLSSHQQFCFKQFADSEFVKYGAYVMSDYNVVKNEFEPAKNNGQIEFLDLEVLLSPSNDNKFVIDILRDTWNTIKLEAIASSTSLNDFEQQRGKSWYEFFELYDTFLEGVKYKEKIVGNLISR